MEVILSNGDGIVVFESRPYHYEVDGDPNMDIFVQVHFDVPEALLNEMLDAQKKGGDDAAWEVWHNS